MAPRYPPRPALPSVGTPSPRLLELAASLDLRRRSTPARMWLLGEFRGTRSASAILRPEPEFRWWPSWWGSAEIRWVASEGAQGAFPDRMVP